MIGFSLHTGVAARADERKKLERLCRYISRPAVSEKRLSLTPHGNLRYQLKTPYRDGTTHVIFEPLTANDRWTWVKRVFILPILTVSSALAFFWVSSSWLTPTLVGSM